MDICQLLEQIQLRSDYAGQLVHLEELPARPGQFAEPSDPLPATLVELLARRDIERLFSHQVTALDAARRKQDAVVVTGTASGKTLCYNLPILESAGNCPDASALYR